MIRITRTQLLMRAPLRPPGYVEDVVSRASRTDREAIYLDDAAHRELLAKYRHTGYEEPSLTDLASRASYAAWRAMAAAVQGDRVLVTQAEYDARTTACGACSYWEASARAGLGRCRAPGCGCTKFKRWLATEQCKHPDGSRWPNLQS